MSVNMALHLNHDPASKSQDHVQFKKEIAALGSHTIYHYSTVHRKPRDAICHIALPDTVLSYRSPSPSMTSVSSPVLSDSSTTPQSELHHHSEAQKDRQGGLDNRQQRIREFPRMMDDNLPRGEAKELRSWSDDDVDWTDFKNMPDYDLYQDESDYSSTPEPDGLLQGLNIADEPYIWRYTKLEMKQDGEEKLGDSTKTTPPGVFQNHSVSFCSSLSIPSGILFAMVEW